MKYPGVLEAHSLTEKTVSRPILLKIREYKQISESIEALELRAKAADATDEFKASAKKTIEEGKIEMAELDVDIVKCINKWVENKPVNAEKARKLREGKAAKRAAANEPAPAPPAEPAAPVVEVPPPPPAEPVIEVPPAQAAAAEPVVEVPAPPAVETPPKAEGKKSSGIGWGWIVGAAALVVGAVFGIRQMNK